jgi:hypothetical protein
MSGLYIYIYVYIYIHLGCKKFPGSANKWDWLIYLYKNAHIWDDDDDDVYLSKLQHGSGLQNISPYGPAKMA